MEHVAIRAEGLGKEYRIGEHSAAPDTLYDQIAGWFGPVRRRKSNSPPPATSHFWALRNVSFAIGSGEVVGVIGRNGAGKSTLLKILSRITSPTEGKVTLRGRVASLLEVGTGFHPELTGKENIFLNGAILGMSSVAIGRRLDEIIDFAEIEGFVDTPVKRYSSGMYVRLAFAVAAHIEPDILLIDEVLAVGDAAFQRKCLGKLDEIRSGGRTVFLVSHNVAAVRKLCTSAILLDKGRIAFHGAVSAALAEYLRTSEAASSVELRDRRDRRGNGAVRVTGFWIEDDRGERLTAITEGRAARFCFSCTSTAAKSAFIALDLRDASGEVMVNFNTADYSDPLLVPAGEVVVKCEVPFFGLRAGSYIGNVFVASSHEVFDWIESAVSVTVVEDELVVHARTAREARVVLPNTWTAESASLSTLRCAGAS